MAGKQKPPPPTLDAKAVPELTGNPKTETTPGDLTVYLKINLANGVQAMTAVYLPDRMKVGSELDVILYLHGHGGPIPIQRYLTKDKDFLLREEIAKSDYKGFVFIAPTLGSFSEAGLLNKDGESYLRMVMNGIFARVDATYAAGIPNFRTVPSVKRIVLAGHSGGGAPMRALASQPYINKKVCEVWCFDSTYGGRTTGEFWMNWINGGHQLERFWVYATKGGTHAAAKFIKGNAAAVGWKYVDVTLEGGLWHDLKSGHKRVPITFIKKLIDTSPILW